MSEDNKGDQEEDKSFRVTYIGNDLSYWKNIQERFSLDYPDSKFVFTHLPVEKADTIKTMLPELLQLRSKIVYLDYSTYTPEVLRLAHNIRRECVLQNVVVVGLLESLESKHFVTLSLSLGVYLNMVKSGEMSSIVHHPMVVAYPDIAKDTDYAVAKVEFMAQAFSQMRVSYFTDSYIHIESSHKFDVGTALYLKTKFFVDCELSGNFNVIRCFDDNIYSTHNYAYDLEYNHMNMEEIDKASVKLEAVKTELARDPKNQNLKYDASLCNGEYEEAKKDAEKDAKEREETLKEWIEFNASKDKSKMTRVLIIDSHMDFLKDVHENIDAFSFSMQYHSKIDENVMRKMRPGIIAFNMDMAEPPPEKQEEAEDGKKDDKDKDSSDKKDSSAGENKKKQESSSVDSFVHLNDLNELKRVCDLSKQQSVEPFIVVYNVSHGEKNIKEVLNNERLMITPDSLNLKSIQKLATLYEAKGGRAKTHDQSKSFGDKERRSYIAKFDAKALAQLQFTINIKELSETELVFSSEEHIPYFSMLYLKRPVKMTITVVPPRDGLGMKVEDGCHYGLVSGLGEIEIAELRKHINQLFFSELEEKKREERSSFDALNKQKLDEQQESDETEDTDTEEDSDSK